MTKAHRPFDFSQLSFTERLLLLQDLLNKHAGDLRTYPLTPAQRQSVANRGPLLQEIWSSLAVDWEASKLTPTRQQELELRIAARERGELTYSSWETVKEQLRKSSRPD
jgi:putative addiction module component (TIGR02574 family)